MGRERTRHKQRISLDSKFGKILAKAKRRGLKYESGKLKRSSEDEVTGK